MSYTIEKKIMNITKLKYFLLSFFMLLFMKSFGQDDKNKESINIDAIIVSEMDAPIEGALISLGKGMVKTHTDSNGHFTLQAKSDNILLISAVGYEDRTILLKTETINDKIVLIEQPYFSGFAYEIMLPAGGKTSQRELTGAISTIKGETLESYPDAVFQNALQGRLMGLVTQMTTNGLGDNTPNLFVRGLGRENNNGALTLVDGIERPLEYLSAEEIESIEVIKDVSAKILYGPRAANGVVLVTTKRGRNNTQIIRGSLEYGVSATTRIPKYLNSADYATLYNEARANDGFSAFYSAADIEGYRQSIGENDLLYPDVNHIDYFLEDSAPFKNANFEFSGGTDDSQYAIFINYLGLEGIEKVGEKVVKDRFSLRGNLDVQITPKLKGHLDVNGVIDNRNWGKLGENQVFSKINTERPNEFPFVITDPNLSPEVVGLGVEVLPPLGGSFLNPNSLYGDKIYGGLQDSQVFFGQTNFGLDWDASGITEGLEISTTVNFDNFQFSNSGQIQNPIRYASQRFIDAGGQDDLVYYKLNQREITDNRQGGGDDIRRSIGWRSNVKYKMDLRKNNKLAFDLSYFYFLNQDKGRLQDIETSNTYFKTSFSHKDKFYVDLSYALMGSNKFTGNKKYMLSHSVSAAWVLSEEQFLADWENLNYLKFKTGYGVMGYDNATSFYLYDTRYSRNGSISFGERNTGGGNLRTGFDNFGNRDLLWETANEFNIGLEGSAFKNTLRFEVNYFNQVRDRIIVDNPTSIFNTINGGLNVPQNLGKVVNNGFEASVDWTKIVGDLNLNIGANALFSKNEVKANNTVFDPTTNVNTIGNPSDAIIGYVSNGLFKTQQEVDNAPFQALGPYGVGNVSYKDLNNDGVVNEQDQTVIGNNFPRTTLGITLNANYKGFGLSILGVSELGVNFIKSNDYFRNSGEGKYSVLANDRFHPVNNPNGTEPILTTLSPLNDTRGSTFWLDSASFFRLKNVELSYSLSKDLWTVKNMKFFLRGANLFVLSNIKDLDPEVSDSGVNNYPLFRTITGGVTLGF
ncbi:SusC/RagA family TonB-linked outer membrane protein [Algibacter amylolyticus]|nr:SusC/RagA family TonB-linked outer membrane protein [Algibacter amylolyticus]